MTKEIRKEIKKILPSQQAQHSRIKDVLVMICDLIDKELTISPEAMSKIKKEVKK